MTKDNKCILDKEPEITALDIVNWVTNQGKRLQPFFEPVVIIPFGDMCFIHPKNLPKEKAIESLKKYWEVYVNDQ